MEEVPWFNQWAGEGNGPMGFGQGGQFGGQYGQLGGQYGQQQQQQQAYMQQMNGGQALGSQYAASDRYTQPYPSRQAGTYQSGPNQYTVNQAPGHAIVISGNGSRGMPTISQQPGTVRG